MAAAFTCTGIRTCVGTYLRWHLTPELEPAQRPHIWLDVVSAPLPRRRKGQGLSELLSTEAMWSWSRNSVPRCSTQNIMPEATHLIKKS
jgi:hypothetical protein